MMELAQSTLHLSYDPATTVLGVTKSTPFGLPAQMVDEDSLITDLQAGEFDASSAYLTQAIQYHLHYIALPPSLNFAVSSELSHYGKVSITLTGGTVDQGDLITLNITLVLPASAKTAPIGRQPGRRRRLCRLDTLAERACPTQEGRLPAHSSGLHRCHERGHGGEDVAGECATARSSPRVVQPRPDENDHPGRQSGHDRGGAGVPRLVDA